MYPNICLFICYNKYHCTNVLNIYIRDAKNKNLKGSTQKRINSTNIFFSYPIDLSCKPLVRKHSTLEIITLGKIGSY